MADMSREEVLARYRHLRAISTRHHTEALRFLSRPALLEQARQLGLTAGEMLVAESMDEFTLVVDLAIHATRPGRSRAIDRYAGAAQLQPGSEEALVLEAMRRARFSVWRVERRLVDIDRWAVLLDQLMEVPEEGAPAERKGGKRE